MLLKGIIIIFRGADQMPQHQQRSVNAREIILPDELICSADITDQHESGLWQGGEPIYYVGCRSGS